MILLWSGLFEGVAVPRRDRYCRLQNHLLKLCGMLGQGYERTLEVGKVKRGRRLKRREGRRGKDFEEQDDSGQRGRGHWSGERGEKWWPCECRGPS